MTAIAILYDTSEGQTEKIARRIADAFRDGDGEAHLHDIHNLPADFQVDRFDGVVIGGSVHAARHSRRLTALVKQLREALSQKPSFFFSVSLSAAGKTERQQQNAQRCIDAFLEETGWAPRHTTTFAGALLYKEYNWFIRWVMKRISRKEGGDTDTSRNYEYTDWDQVEAFARQCAQEVLAETARSA